jgi:hypothetical protein|nr:hypothetical protein [Neorhizobium tomejilense]
MTDIFALLFGAAIVIFFSYERFNRSTDQTGQQLLRLVSLLSPDKLRSRRVVTNAYIFYAATFLVIYLFLCAYAQLIPQLGGPAIPVGAIKLPVLQEDAKATITSVVQTFEDVSDTALLQSLSGPAEMPSKSRDIDIGIDAATSLAVALMIVGLAPAFPILQSFEAWIRSAAHRLAGIPTRVIGIREDLRNRTLDITVPEGKVPADTLLIPRGDWLRMILYKSSIKDQLDSPEEFHNDILLIFAVSAWILDHKLNLSNLQERERFAQLEHELGARTELLVDALDEKTDVQQEMQSADDQAAKHADGNPSLQAIALPDSRAVPHAQERLASWTRLAKQADELADDMCLLLALYLEHEIIGPASFEGTTARAQPAVASSVAVIERSPAASGPGAVLVQRKHAMQRLKDFLREYADDHAVSVRFRTHATIIGLWTFFVTLIITVIWSQYPGKFETMLKDGFDPGAYWRLATYTLTAFIAYSIPMTVALAIRDGSQHLRRWWNIFETTWTNALPQVGFVLFASCSAATAIILASAFWSGGVIVGFSGGWENLGRALGFSFAYNAPIAFRGSLLALIVIVLIDAWDARSRSGVGPPTRLWSLAWGAGTAVFMAFAGGGTRLLSTLAGSLQASVPRVGLDSIDLGLIVYTAMYSALLGFCIAFSISEVLISRRPSREEKSTGAGAIS